MLTARTTRKISEGPGVNHIPGRWLGAISANSALRHFYAT